MGIPSVVKVIVAWLSLRVIIVPWTRTALIVVSWVRMPPKIITESHLRILVIVNGRIELLRRPSSGPSLLQLLLILLLILLLMQLLIHQRR